MQVGVVVLRRIIGNTNKLTTNGTSALRCKGQTTVFYYNRELVMKCLLRALCSANTWPLSVHSALILEIACGRITTALKAYQC